MSFLFLPDFPARVPVARPAVLERRDPGLISGGSNDFDEFVSIDQGLIVLDVDSAGGEVNPGVLNPLSGAKGLFDLHDT